MDQMKKKSFKKHYWIIKCDKKLPKNTGYGKTKKNNYLNSNGKFKPFSSNTQLFISKVEAKNHCIDDYSWGSLKDFTRVSRVSTLIIEP